MARILVVDDEPDLRRLVVSHLKTQAHEVVEAVDGLEALKFALGNPPDLIILDVQMPNLSGFEVCKELRQNLRTRYVPILFLTARRQIPDKIQGLALGADDYLAKPFHAGELDARINGILRRSSQQLGANPLTRLPGGPAIEEEALRRLRSGQLFAFTYIDIDHFKAYNDFYGYKKGDEVIKALAQVIIETTDAKGDPDDFVGHIGGDDFITLGRIEGAAARAQIIAERFDRQSPMFYADKERERGFIVTRGRRGQEQEFPLMTLSIAVVDTESKTIEHYARLAQLASELKTYAKSSGDRKVSLVVTDRRKE
ncbi:MAG: response regulator [Elusimicrobia bacterium]|nr:response regulator [Elusimicrobiota bacterium]